MESGLPTMLLGRSISMIAICDEENLLAVHHALNAGRPRREGGGSGSGRTRLVESVPDWQPGGVRGGAPNEEGVTILVQHFRKVEEAAKPGDFVFCDPPYVPISKTSNFTGYASGGFGDKDQTDLRDMALRMKRNGVKVLLCNSNAPFVRRLYDADFEVHEVQMRRNINSKGDKRGSVTEVLIT